MLDFNLNHMVDDKVVYEYKAPEERDVNDASLYSEILDSVMSGLDIFAWGTNDWTLGRFDSFDDLVTGAELPNGEGTVWLIHENELEDLRAAFRQLKSAVVAIMLTMDCSG